MAYINSLYNKALELIKTDGWGKSNYTIFKGKNGKTYTVSCRIICDFELGKMYIADSVVIFVLPKEHKIFFDNAKKVISDLKYADTKMKMEFSRALPKIIDTFETQDDLFGVVIEKSKDMILLKDIYNYYNGKIEDRHVAWIQSRLQNIVCYLDYAKLSHNAISLDTLFISPQSHVAALLGGWWYATPLGKKLIGVPASTYLIMPPSVKINKVSNISTDLELIRAVGRELLGDRNGTKLLSMKTPKPMVDWLRMSMGTNPFKDFDGWDKVLEKSFGKRKFIEMKLNVEMVYPK